MNVKAAFPAKSLRKPLRIALVVIVVLAGLLFFLASLGGEVDAAPGMSNGLYESFIEANPEFTCDDFERLEVPAIGTLPNE